MKLIIQD